MKLVLLRQNRSRLRGGAAAPPYQSTVGRTCWSAQISRSFTNEISRASRSLFATALLACLIDHAANAQQYDRGQEPPKLSPADSAKDFIVPDDLQIDLILSEPTITQPLQLSFDERGRLWVVEYRQYPEPAGLKQVSHDKFWRSVYDKVPLPPPDGVKGKDRISIHEDTNGDGTFDSHKVFVDGLNIATSCARGRGGVWVLNPPYLLFYPDRNNDDIPDGDPEVHLSGFGLEDTHSVANSLRWGPDGWLYGCQGSTTSGHIKVLPLPTDTAPVSTNIVTTLGQNIWRYQPETRRYEVFAEGGGNAFGLEVDAQGRVFSGHNGGDTRGFHYVQGGYLQKGFQKHGELSNPYAYGYFPQMKNNQVERFTHTFLIYQGDALPERYRGKLFGIEPLQGRVVLSEIKPTGSTFETHDIEHVVTTTDRWFRPVDIKLGPDGAIYIADWNDFSINHWRNYNGNMDKTGGRVWRLKAKGAKPAPRFDLGKKSDNELVAELNNPNRWWRETASRLLIDRADSGNYGTFTKLQSLIETSTGQQALEALWTWQAIRARLPATELLTQQPPEWSLLKHSDPQVRLWTVRIIGDWFSGLLDSGGIQDPHRQEIQTSGVELLPNLAETEPSLEVRVQLAATAKRLPPRRAIPLIKALAQHDEDATDPRQPLMIWWALEAKAGDRDAVLKLFDDPAFWDRPLVKQALLERIMRRYADAGSQEDLLTCAKLLDRSPSKADSEILMHGFETAFKGRSVAGLPDELITAMARHGVGSVAVGLRRGDPKALDEALKVIASPEAPVEQRRQFIEVLGEIKSQASKPTLLQLAANEKNSTVLQAVFVALQPFDDPSIATATIGRLPGLPADAQTAALTLLTGRSGFASRLINAVEDQKVPAASVPLEFARKMKGTADESVRVSIDRLWPKAGRPTSADMDREMDRLAQALREGQGDPYEGKKIFTATCAGCHTLFNQGADIGPDLTSLNRRDEAGLLLAIVNPSAEIREGYENFSVDTKDDRSLTGFIVEQDERKVIMRGFDGHNVVLQRDNIASLRSAGMSLMPEGLTTGMDDQKIRDLFAYLRSSQPLSE
ncbi:c-type cytochrome [bacterium]|nr:c-type cytochrome [bacterium]